MSRQSGLKAFPALRDSTAEALRYMLEDDEETAIQKTRAAFNAEIHPRLGALLVEIFLMRSWMIAMGDLPKEERHPLPWLDDHDPDFHRDSFEVACEEFKRLMDVFEKASFRAVVGGDAAFFEQLSYCFSIATDPNASAQENLDWLTAWNMASINDRRTPPSQSEVASWFNGPGPTQEKSAKQAGQACERVNLRLPTERKKKSKE